MCSVFEFHILPFPVDFIGPSAIDNFNSVSFSCRHLLLPTHTLYYLRPSTSQTAQAPSTRFIIKVL